MRDDKFNKSVGKNSEAGLSAVELLIAMAIFLVVMSSVYGILKIGNLSRSTVNSRSENIKNVRTAINAIGREAVNAGLGYHRVGGTVPDNFTSDNFMLPPDADEEPDLLTAISSGNDISESDLSKKGEKNDVMAFAFRDFEFNDGFPIQINDVIETATSLILKTPDGACANCSPYDLFLLETSDGKQALILSTDIINKNQIVLGGGNTDPLKVNYGNSGSGNSGSGNSGSGNSGSGNSGSSGSGNSGNGNGNAIAAAQKAVQDAQARVDDVQEDLDYAISKNDLIKIASETAKLTPLLVELSKAKTALSALLGNNNGGGNGGGTSGSNVKKCTGSNTKNCINYGTTSVVAKKIYLVSYHVAGDGTLMRTTYGNNTGATAAEQILRQPIAQGVRSLKIQYLLTDGTVTEDPSYANTQKERCNEIVQIEVTIVVDAESAEGTMGNSEPITLTSTFSTRNLKYDVY